MKRTKTLIALILIVVLFGAALYYLWQKNQDQHIIPLLQQQDKDNIDFQLPRSSQNSNHFRLNLGN